MDLSSNKSLHLTMPPNRFHDPTRPIQPDTSPLHNVKQPRSSSNETQRQPSHEDHQTFFYSRNNGGAGRDRTDDLKLAKLPLSQLSYGPFLSASNASSVRATSNSSGTTNHAAAKLPKARPRAAHVCASQLINGGPGTTRTSDLTLIRGAL